MSQDFWRFFLPKRFDLGPIWTDKNGFANFFIFAKIFSESVCPRIVNNYADTYKNTTFGNFWRLLTDFKGTIRWIKVLGCVYKPNSNNLKIWKCLYLKKNLHVRVVIDNVDPGPRSNLLSKNIHQKSRDTVPLTPKQGFLIIFCKGQTKFFTPVFSHNSKQSGPFIYMLKYFCI